MTRRNGHISGAVAARVTDDPRQGWLFPMEELLNHGDRANRYGDFVQEFVAPVVADPTTGSEV